MAKCLTCSKSLNQSFKAKVSSAESTVALSMVCLKIIFVLYQVVRVHLICFRMPIKLSTTKVFSHKVETKADLTATMDLQTIKLSAKIGIKAVSRKQMVKTLLIAVA